MRSTAAVIALLLAACTETPADPLAAARQAIESAPSDPAPRIVLARLYLDQGRGDLAEVLIDQAIERGTPARSLVPERAEALRLAGKIAELDALPIPEEPVARAQVLATRAKAEPSDAAFQLLYAALDNANLPKIRTWADADPAAGRARAQHDCARSPPENLYTWDQPTTPPTTAAVVFAVSSTQELQAAARTAPDSAIIEIAAGDYSGAVAQWHQNHLTVRGVGGRPHISAAGKSVEDRDVWLFSGNDVTVENVEISGAHSRHNKNGASIRFMGRNLTLRHVYLHDSEDGLLTSNGHPDSSILIEYSEFARNGDGEGQAHNVYVGVSGQVIFRFNYSHESNVGHLFKSRAARTVIAYNYLADHATGTSSRSIDLPDGGRDLIIGNVIDHGASSVNRTIIGYGTENSRYDDNALQIVNNTFYNRYLNALAIDNRRATVVALVVNNLFAGAPLVRLEGAGKLIGNMDRADNGLVDPRDGDYSINASSPAVDAGVDPVTLGLPDPDREYVHPVSARSRAKVWKIDVGAYERCGFVIAK